MMGVVLRVEFFLVFHLNYSFGCRKIENVFGLSEELQVHLAHYFAIDQFHATIIGGTLFTRFDGHLSTWFCLSPTARRSFTYSDSNQKSSRSSFVGQDQ
jgi:hypothetical protein